MPAAKITNVGCIHFFLNLAKLLDTAYATNNFLKKQNNYHWKGQDSVYPHTTGSAEPHTTLPFEQLPFPLMLKNIGYYQLINSP